MMYWSVCISVCWRVFVCVGDVLVMCWCVLVCVGVCWCVLVCVRDVLVHVLDCAYVHVLVCFCMCWCVLVCVGVCWCVLVCVRVCS